MASTNNVRQLSADQKAQRKPLTSQWKVHKDEKAALISCPVHHILQIPIFNLLHQVFTQEVDVLEELREQPVQRVVEADPLLGDVKIDDLVCPIAKRCHPKAGFGELVPVKGSILQVAYHQNLIDDGGDGMNEIGSASLSECFSVGLDHPGQRQGNVEHIHPRFGLVLDVIRRSPLVRI